MGPPPWHPGPGSVDGGDALQQIPTQGRRRGVRASLRNAGNLVSRGEIAGRRAATELADAVRRPIAADPRVAVLSLKGGVGKTTVTMGLGSALASMRSERVIAVDANPDLGTLARRLPSQTPSTVRDLLSDPNLAHYADIRRHTSQSMSRLEVLASERDPAISEAFTDDEYRQVIRILEHHYGIILTDCGTGLVHSAMAGVLSMANSVVLVTTPAIDGAQSAAVTLDWLHAHGYERLARESVVVIASARQRESPVDVQMLSDYFSGRVRAVQIIPFDEHLAVGGHIDLGELTWRTRAALLELASTVVDPFVARTPPPAPQGFSPYPGYPYQ